MVGTAFGMKEAGRIIHTNGGLAWSKHNESLLTGSRAWAVNFWKSEKIEKLKTGILLLFQGLTWEKKVKKARPDLNDTVQDCCIHIPSEKIQPASSLN